MFTDISTVGLRAWPIKGKQFPFMMFHIASSKIRNSLGSSKSNRKRLGFLVATDCEHQKYRLAGSCLHLDHKF